MFQLVIQEGNKVRGFHPIEILCDGIQCRQRIQHRGLLHRDLPRHNIMKQRVSPTQRMAGDGFHFCPIHRLTHSPELLGFPHHQPHQMGRHHLHQVLRRQAIELLKQVRP